MNDDDLRARLRRVDPAAPGGSADDAGAARAQSLLEGIMSTPAETPVVDKPAPRPTRPWLVPLGAAAAVAGIALVAALATGDGGTDDDSGPSSATAPLQLRAPDGTTMASCLRFEVQYLRDMSPAFGGTVTDVDAGTVLLEVDRWYAPKGNDVTHVELSTGSATPVSIEGVEFEEGKRYLVTASNGTVNTCGYTGLATPEYERAFEEAFGG